MEILYYKVNNIKESIITSSFPMLTSTPNIERLLDDNDYKRAIKLGTAKNGSGHDCFLKGINVFMVIQASLKWWKQWDRYHFQDTVSSTSTMHKILELKLDDVLPDTIFPETKKKLENKIHKYKEMKKAGCSDDELSDLFEVITDNLPQGFLYTRGVTLNYLQLKSMYLQRKHHKLKEWRDFCKFIEELPLFKKIVLNN